MRCVARIWLAISGAGFITKYVVLKVTFWQVRGLAGSYRYIQESQETDHTTAITSAF